MGQEGDLQRSVPCRFCRTGERRRSCRENETTGEAMELFVALKEVNGAGKAFADWSAHESPCAQQQ